jgi:hypothetical protein
MRHPMFAKYLLSVGDWTLKVNNSLLVPNKLQGGWNISIPRLLQSCHVGHVSDVLLSDNEQVWNEELKTPIIGSKYHDSYLTSARWSPTRCVFRVCTACTGLMQLLKACTTCILCPQYVSCSKTTIGLGRGAGPGCSTRQGRMGTWTCGTTTRSSMSQCCRSRCPCLICQFSMLVHAVLALQR